MKPLIFAVFLSLQAGLSQGTTIQSFQLSEDHSHLSIHLSDGAVLSAPLTAAKQSGFSNVQVSPNRHLIGWTVTFSNCCTSYPIPLKLMILVNGTVRAFTGNGLPIWRWAFLASGTQFAFQQETVHGGLNVHYELHDVATGRRLAEYDPPVASDNRPLPRRNVPKWVSELDDGQ